MEFLNVPEEVLSPQIAVCFKEGPGVRKVTKEV